MGVAGVIFEPRPPDCQNSYNFKRCLSDVNFFISLLVSDIKKIQKSSPSMYRDVHELGDDLNKYAATLGRVDIVGTNHDKQLTQ